MPEIVVCPDVKGAEQVWQQQADDKNDVLQVHREMYLANTNMMSSQPTIGPL